MSAWTRQMVAAAMNDDDWAEFVDGHDPVFLATEIRRVLKDIGHQEFHRAQGLALLRDDDDITDEEYQTAKRGLKHWRRSISRVKPRLNERLAEVNPRAQAVIDAHQADRRQLVILAKRIWLWEQGADEDGLDDALDDCTISESTAASGRKSLRDLIDEIRDAGSEVTP